MLPLSGLEVLIVDCQATAAAPRGHLLELGWARLRPDALRPQARLIKLPEDERIPPAVVRITGISWSLIRSGVDACAAWHDLSQDASMLPRQPAPAVAHFARFELPFITSLAAGEPPLDLICTHAIARRLLPGLPRCSLRALTGYFGRPVGELRRSTEHVEATAFIWRELVRLLDDEGVSTWDALKTWLAAPATAPRRGRRIWPMPRDERLSLPDAPGVYRLLRTSGDVLYVGKASSLHHRVNSYFRKQHGIPERMLEMLSQVRAVSIETTPTAVEAALLEPDEIKRLRPQYNLALAEDRELWFATPDLNERSLRPSSRCRVGPIPSALMLDQFSALARGSRAALGSGRWAPEPAVFADGYARLRAAHVELARDDVARAHSRLLRLANRLWREGRRDADAWDDPAAEDGRPPDWTPEYVQFSLERLALRAALARRRAAWLTRLFDASVVWREPGSESARLIVIERGEIVSRASVEGIVSPPAPPGHRRSGAERQEAFTLATFDRLRVLTTELRRLASEGAPIAVRFGEGPPLAGARLACALSWV